jgi:hypothetical protein
MILDRVADFQRLQPDLTNANKESYQAYVPLQNVPIDIQPATNEDTVVAQGVFGHTWTGFTSISGMLVGDKLVIQQTGENLIVRGVQNWMSPELGPHTELLLAEFETPE